jgi:rhodanese-related sulfurtransferase
MDPHFDGVIFKTHAGEVRRRLRVPFPPYWIVDVRPREEFESGHIPGALWAPPDGIVKLPEGTTDRTEFVVVGQEAEDPSMRAATLALKGLGAHRVVELTGGMVEWELAGGPMETSERRAA